MIIIIHFSDLTVFFFFGCLAFIVCRLEQLLSYDILFFAC